MLSTYRVIALSLVTAVFFAAPLLCIHPISTQIKKAEHRQNRKVRVVSHRATHKPQIFNRRGSAAWARSIHRTGLKTYRNEDGRTLWSHDEDLYEDYGDLDLVREDGATEAIGMGPHSDL